MDDAELRRGRPTTHRVHGEATAMTAGAVLIPAAALQAWRGARSLGRSAEESTEVVAALCRAAGAAGMVGGQVLDLEGEGRSLSAEELDGLHRMKTGAILAAAPRVGALAAGAPAEVTDAFARYGRAVGLAFQIADDILDATSTAGELGKNPSDEELRKSTYVSVHGLEEARRRAVRVSGRARKALADAGIRSPLLEELADYVVRRRR
jgi:geranylgeranyl pyrophosphate synthase